MKMEMKLTAAMYGAILADLRRPHEFAAERVGFCSVRQTPAGEGVLLLIDHYFPVADEHYIDDPQVGAKIGEPALTEAIHRVYYGRETGTGLFHTHLHNHSGPTAMSKEDRGSIPTVVDGFRQVNAKAPHGLIIFSVDHAHVLATAANGDDILEQVDVVGVIGPRLLTFRSETKHV
jgi:hypothetical protein